MYLRVSNGAVAGIEYGGYGACSQIQLGQSPATASVHHLLGIRGPIAEVGVPVAVLADRSNGEDDFFDVVTMLAVLEHIEPPGIPDLMREVYRVLKTGGVFILTTPTSWTDGFLRLLAKLRLVSQVEIADHKDVYTHNKVRDILREARFPEKNISLGYFEAFMNIWARASK